MRRNIGILVFFLVLTAPIFCQDEKQPDCPKISVSGPSGLPLISTDGVIFDFDASIEDPHPEIIGFSWIATGGEIIDGQNTPHIRVRQPEVEVGGNVTATIYVSGFPNGCRNTDSATAGLTIGRPARKIDEYDSVSLRKEKARIDAALSQFKKEPNMFLFVVMQAPAADKRLDARLRTIGEYIGATLPADRFTLKTINAKHVHMIIFLIPPGTSLPF
jgi:hypothetical protein